MNLFTIAWKSIRQRFLSSSLTAFSVALGVMLIEWWFFQKKPGGWK